MKLTKEPFSIGHFDNALTGLISNIETSEENTEIIIVLDGGEILCSTLPNQEANNLKLHSGDKITALFNADQVIIATLC